MNRLQGLGAPVDMTKTSNQQLTDIDPTLDACCQREVASNRRANALDETLLKNQHATLQQERMRRNLVETLKFSGCRCCYDPDNDGTGDYRALEELRLQQQQSLDSIDGDDGDERSNRRETIEHDDDPIETLHGGDKTQPDSDADDDDDSEYDYLLNDDNHDISHDVDLERIQANRMAELQWQLLQKQQTRQHGYGAHRQMHPTRVLRAAGLASNGSEALVNDFVVLHLYDPDSVRCAQLDLYLEQQVAPKHFGTRFMKCGGRSCLLMDVDLASKSLGHLQADRDVPALIAIQQGRMVACCPGLVGLFDSNGTLVTRQVDEWLDRTGVLSTEPPRDVCRIRPEEDALMEYLVHQKNTDQRDKESIFECGVAGCEKGFYHEHVGIQTEHQSGLVVQESAVLGDET
ncbi:hypothetical protein MPSEU_000335600 [Mayamaea pseudoterrestris]|nr:hypothetical protein MPSEU_000335600 [Mayamaea pseudoterrestris]